MKMRDLLVYLPIFFAVVSESYGEDESDFIERHRSYSTPVLAKGPQKFFKHEIELIQDKDLKIKGIILVKGKNMFSTWITKRTKADVSHAALWLSDQFGNDYIYESTGSPGQMKDGIRPQVQIGLFNEVLDHYPSKVWTREIDLNDDHVVAPFTIQALVAKYLGTPYTKDPRDLTNAAWHAVTKEKTDHIFCSQLVALILKDPAVGLLPAERPSGNYLPKHFFFDPLEPFHLELTHATWGEQKLIKDKKGRRLEQLPEA